MCAKGLRSLGVEATFLLVRAFPPPAARAQIFARLDGPGAGRTPDGGEAPFVQRIATPDAFVDIGDSEAFDLKLGEGECAAE